MQPPRTPPCRIAVVGSGIAGLSAAWLLSQRHDVTLYEADDRLGGHSHTIDAPTPEGTIAVDTGFIVYNAPCYPTLTALFAHLGVATKPAPMSFAVSLDDGALEYSSAGLAALFAQKRNLASPRFWSMLRDLLRFQRTAPGDLAQLEGSLVSLEDYLIERGYGAAFRNEHLLPQAAAIWSCGVDQMADYPAASFIRFYQNHRLLKIDVKPTWRTVEGGSRTYVAALLADFRGKVERGRAVTGVLRTVAGPGVRTADGALASYDHVVLATHSDQALRLLESPDAEERRLLGAIRYGKNRVVLHRDAGLMPQRRAAWAAWNHLGRGGEGGVTYWMNRLQSLPGPDLFVSLNPPVEPRRETVIRDDEYEHPIFDAAAIAAQRELWSLQGVRNTWFCGAWFGWGFHEDGLQAGLAVAEQLGGVMRPWTVADQNGRIAITAPRRDPLEEAAA
jgi:predicted NAD/FAD-binding protein